MEIAPVRESPAASKKPIPREFGTRPGRGAYFVACRWGILPIVDRQQVGKVQNPMAISENDEFAVNPSEDGDTGNSLSPEDLERVRRYLNSPIHSVDRKPFRPFLMMIMLVAAVSSLSLVSLLIAWIVLE